MFSGAPKSDVLGWDPASLPTPNSMRFHTREQENKTTKPTTNCLNAADYIDLSILFAFLVCLAFWETQKEVL